MSSAQVLVTPSGKPKTITDLPPELITSIYKHVDKFPSITALNSTCRKFYLIWQLNAVSISSAVTYNTISSLPLALELLNVQESIQGSDLTVSPPPTDRPLQVQQEARNAVQKDQKGAYQGTFSSNCDYSMTLVRNKALISNAKKVDHAHAMVKRSLFHDRDPPRETFIAAYYRVWIIATLDRREAVNERLLSIKGQDMVDLAAVAMCLYKCRPNRNKNYLEISQRVETSGAACAEGDLPDWGKASWSKAITKTLQAFGDGPMG